jgi:23S rRNA (uracil1939-C5)-methyltransferase
MDLVVTADRMAAGGDAIAREPSGRVVFVSGALPGEQVLVRLVQERRDYAKAVVVEVLEPHPARRSPPCPYVAVGCGGCSWQHIDPFVQLELKRDIVIDALRRTAKLPDASVELGPSLPSDRYRTTVRLGVDAHGRVGQRAARSHDLVPLDDCLVAHPLVAELLADLRVRGADEVVLRVGARTGQRLAWCPESPSRSGRARIEGLPTDVAVGGSAVINEVIGGVTLRASARSFLQSSPEVCEALVDAVRHAAGDGADAPGETMVDAYGGIGLFAAVAFPHAAPIVVEQSPSSCADAIHNLNGRDAIVEQTSVETWRPVRARLVVADPARSGLDRRAVDVLDATHCDVLVLVSCDPVALARDTALLGTRGLVHRGSVVLDPFPHTPHVEVVTRFERMH